jgi:hypothetical protein
MQPQIMTSLGTFAFIMYFVCVIAIIISILRLLGRFVGAQEKMAASLGIIARKLKDETKP